MGKLATIFKDTAIYGLSSIIGRFLNYLLVPSIPHSCQQPAEAMVLLRTSMPMWHWSSYC